MKGPCVRFAPSPTGPLHIGALRTALYGYIFAKKHGGQFLLRIEDTDTAREVEGAVEYISQALDWMEILPDEVKAPQSTRKDLYRKEAECLREKGMAYYAFDTSEELEKMRATLKQKHTHYQHYNALTRLHMKNELTLPSEQVQEYLNQGVPYVMRLKISSKEVVSFEDKIRGRVSVHSSTLEDKVLLKSDGMPTYHFAHVVDDHYMCVSHVIRGEEWLPSTPLHILLYRALGWKPPVFAHLPLLLKSTGKGKLSKRDMEKSDILIYPLQWKSLPGFREEGYLSEALFNFLVYLGWTAPDGKELLSREDIIAAFELEKIHKAGMRFDMKKMQWFNQQYIRQLTPIQLVKKLRAQCTDLSDDKLLQITHMMQDRVTTLKEILTSTTFLHTCPVHFSMPSGEEKTLLQTYMKHLKQRGSFEKTPDLEKQLYLNLAKEQNLSVKTALKGLRYALTVSDSGPDIMKIMYYLGVEEAMTRISNYINVNNEQDKNGMTSLMRDYAFNGYAIQQRKIREGHSPLS